MTVMVSVLTVVFMQKQKTISDLKVDLTDGAIYRTCSLFFFFTFFFFFLSVHCCTKNTLQLNFPQRAVLPGLDYLQLEDLLVQLARGQNIDGS